MPRANGSNALAVQFNPIIYFELDICSVLHTWLCLHSICHLPYSRDRVPFSSSSSSFSYTHYTLNIVASRLFDSTYHIRPWRSQSRAKLSSLFYGCSKAHEKVIRGKVPMHTEAPPLDAPMQKFRTELNERH